MRPFTPRFVLLLLWVSLLGCPSGDPDPDPDPIPTVDPWADGCSAEEPEFRMIDVGEVSLHVACQGTGPTIVMLHGFPEFWMGWNQVMDLLSDRYRVIAPDQRGYNTSDKPFLLEEYELDRLVGDLGGLIDVVGGPVTVVGHDWGGAVAWAAGADLPSVDRLVIMNAPHMNVFADLLANDEEQQDAFSYLNLFVAEGTEDLMVANDFALLVQSFDGVLTEDELVHYKTAWGQKRAVEGGLNWYRANFTDGLPNVDRDLNVDIPTLVMWGMDDTALLPKNMDGLDAYVSDLTLEEVEGATHWIAHEVPGRVADSIAAFIP
ncbi:MAG: alpha/beta hydrolase [Deltaproteobacteria bacterium]|nr:alpha/beta hydrolase [Deltaproteobacteria bacterium]